MKKQSLLYALAATLLLATSCSTDAEWGMNEGDAVVRINLSTPQMATRAYSDGTMATNLQYAVYDENKQEDEVIEDKIHSTEDKEEIVV